MLEFAEMASGDHSDLDNLAAIMRLLEASVHPDDWTRFKTTARKGRAQIERDLMPVVVALFEAAAERPTQRPSDSSDGSSATGPRSTAVSSGPASDRLHVRPDLMVIVQDAQASQAG